MCRPGHGGRRAKCLHPRLPSSLQRRLAEFPMNRSISRLLGFVCALASVLSPVNRATAAAGDRPHLSSGNAQFTSASDFVGAGSATHLGHYTEAGSVGFTPTSDPAILHVDGFTDYTAANGDVLHAVVSGELNLLTGAITATLTYDGGTGRFDDATGSATLLGQLLPGGGVAASVSGTVNY